MENVACVLIWEHRERIRNQHLTKCYQRLITFFVFFNVETEGPLGDDDPVQEHLAAVLAVVGPLQIRYPKAYKIKTDGPPRRHTTVQLLQEPEDVVLNDDVGLGATFAGSHPLDVEASTRRRLAPLGHVALQLQVVAQAERVQVRTDHHLSRRKLCRTRSKSIGNQRTKQRSP